jgi:hypothetical protein
MAAFDLICPIFWAQLDTSQVRPRFNLYHPAAGKERQDFERPGGRL